MDQLVCASLSHTHYWYEVAKLKINSYSLVYFYTLFEQIDFVVKIQLTVIIGCILSDERRDPSGHSRVVAVPYEKIVNPTD